jgi:hypothetical protein
MLQQAIQQHVEPFYAIAQERKVLDGICPSLVLNILGDPLRQVPNATQRRLEIV